MTRFALLAAAFVLGGCTNYHPGSTTSIFYTQGASVDANEAPRGSRAFCERYAQQSQDNYFEGGSDAGDSFGSNALVYEQAKTAGNKAYQRCLAGRTN